MTARRCLVLGGHGFIGQALTARLVSEGHQVCVFGRPAEARARAPGSDGVRHIDGDFLDRDRLSSALEGADVVFHLVSTTLPKNSNDDPAHETATNILGTVGLLDLCVSRGVGRVVFASSGGTVYGRPLYVPLDERHPTDPVCAYGVGKLAIEKFLHLYEVLHGLSFRVLRMSNVYGPGQVPFRGQGAVAVFAYRMLRGEPVEIWGDGTVVRDHVYVADVARAFAACMAHEGSRRIVNIGSGEGLSLNELLQRLEQIIGRRSERRYMSARRFDVPANILDVTVARDELGWRPETGLQDGLVDVVRWIGCQRF